MSLKSTFAQAVGKSTNLVLNTILNMKSSFPETATITIDPDILRTLEKNYDVVLTTGTGKAEIASLAIAALNKKYQNIVSNNSDSDNYTGIIAALLTAKRNPNNRPLAILAVAESNLQAVTKNIKPRAIIVNNLLKEQDSTAPSVKKRYQQILTGITNAPNATIIMNADSPIINSTKLPNSQIFFGFNTKLPNEPKASSESKQEACPQCGHELQYHYMIAENLGNYFCVNCGYERPNLNFAVTSLDRSAAQATTIAVDGDPITAHTHDYQAIYNTLAAYSAARFLGVSPRQIQQAFEKHNFKPNQNQ